MKKNKKLLVVIIGITVAIVGVVVYNKLCFVDNSDEDRIRVGAILPLTGEFADEGQKARWAIEMAMQDMTNDTSCAKISCFFEDGKFTGKDSVAAYQRLKTQKVDAVIAFGTPCASVTRSMAKKDGIPLIAIDGTAGGDTTNPWLFICVHSVRSVGEALATYVSDSSFGRIAVVYMQGESGESFFDGFISRKLFTLVATESYPYGASETQDVVSKILAKKPDTICVFGYGHSYVSLLNRILESGFSGRIVTDMNIESVSDKIKDRGCGISYISLAYGTASNNNASKLFIKRMQNIHKIQPSLFSAFAYEAVMMMRMPSTGQRIKTETIRQHLLTYENKNSLVGYLKYTANRDLVLPFCVYQLGHAGNVVYVDEIANGD